MLKLEDCPQCQIEEEAPQDLLYWQMRLRRSEDKDMEDHSGR